MVLGVTSQLLRLRYRQCAALSGPWGHPPRSSARGKHTHIRVTRLHGLHLWYLNSHRDVLNVRHCLCSMNCTCGISTVLALSSIRITPVGLARSCQAGRSIALLPQWNPESFEPLGQLLRQDRDFDGLVDELQLLTCQALSEPSALVVSQQQACHSCCSRAESVKFHQCPVDTCVEDETVDSLGASAVRSLILFGAHRYACVTSYASVVISGSLR